jgi:hypothetical protein
MLTEHDQDLLVAVHRHGFMTSDLVELLSDGAAGPQRSLVWITRVLCCCASTS